MISWILEPDVHGFEEVRPLMDAIKAAGQQYKCIDYLGKPREQDWHNFFPLTDKVLFYGSLELAAEVNASSYYPATIATLENFDTSVYYPHFEEHLLNTNCLKLTLGQVLANAKGLAHYIGETVFIRPLSGNKPFKGAAFELADLQSYSFVKDNLDCPVQVSEYKELGDEWRLVVGPEGTIIAASKYMNLKGLCSEPGAPQAVIDYGNWVLHMVKWRPDPFFVMDVVGLGLDCDHEPKFAVVELNAFSTSGLYSCDYKAIVEAVGKYLED